MAEIVWVDERKTQAFETICERIETSELGVDHICAADENLPSARTFYKWIRDDDSDVLRQRYARAREAQQHFCIDNGIVLATQLVARNPAYQVDPAAFRAYFDAVKWRASKLFPKVYGEKQEVEHSGAVGFVVELKDYSKRKQVESNE